MSKYLLIAGSPRRGNTDYILEKVFSEIDGEKDILYLREKNINHCLGCLVCDETNECVQKDDMADIYQRLIWADVFIVGTPNYFNNVPGLLKNFMDRMVPFYETDALKGKKLINIIVGSEPANESKLIVQLLKYFAASFDVEVADNFYFQALGADEVRKNPDNENLIKNIIDNVNTI